MYPANKKRFEEFLAKHEGNAEVWAYIETIRNVTSRIRRVFPLSNYPSIRTPMNAPGVKVTLDFEDDPSCKSILVNIDIFVDQKIEWFIKNRESGKYAGNEERGHLSDVFGLLHSAFSTLK